MTRSLVWDFATLHPNINTCPYPVPVLDVDGKATGKMRECGLPCANPRNKNSKVCVRHQMAWVGYKNKIQRDKKLARAMNSVNLVENLATR
jgi:hypothetical protein